MGICLKLRIAGSAALAALYFLFPPFSSGGAWGQYLTRSEFAQSRAAPTTKFRTGGTRIPAALGLQPAPVRPAASTAAALATPAPGHHPDPGHALASCE